MTTMTDTAVTTASDSDLLGEYVGRGSHDAFAALVARHADLVYAVALRRLHGDRSLADDVAQAVFIVLARRARSLHAGILLPGWLHRTTCYAAANAIKMETRRKKHERQFAGQSDDSSRGHAGLDPQHDAAWRDVRPVLDDALARLGETDRNAILLRYYRGNTVEQTGSALGLSVEAAKKRLQRALDKLRAALVRKGVTLPAATIGAALAAHANVAGAAQLALVADAAAGALSTSAIGAAGAASAPHLIAKGTITMLTMNQVRLVTAWAVAAVVIVAGGVGLVPRLAPMLFASDKPAATQPADADPPKQVAFPPVEAPKFGPVIEVTVNDDGVGNNECLDFDTGKTHTAPGRFANRAEGAKWFRDTGADMHAETESGAAGFYAMDLAVVPVERERFDAIEVHELQAEMSEARPNRPMISAEEDLPATFQFRTREGALGIGQIVEMDRGPNEHGWLKIRYKLLVPGR